MEIKKRLKYLKLNPKIVARLLQRIKYATDGGIYRVMNKYLRNDKLNHLNQIHRLVIYLD